VRGTVRVGDASATRANTFTPTAIHARWTTTAHGVTVTFPRWGDARIDLTGTWTRVKRFRVANERGGYEVTLAAPANARLLEVAPQPSAPAPGPTVEVAVEGSTLAARLSLL
jgi:hypothetical protein